VLSARARALKGGHAGILRIGATPMVIEHLLSTFLGKYQVRHPGVEVHFVEDGGLRLPILSVATFIWRLSFRMIVSRVASFFHPTTSLCSRARIP
jgi:hypothetical protein